MVDNNSVYEIEGKSGKIFIVTDKIEYNKPDQVFPLHPENQFYLDELVLEKIKGKSVLELGIGSGVLSIAAAKAGANNITALEINPRAKIYAGFNAFVNGVSDQIIIKDGNIDDIFEPVKDKQFDYFISNPPFEPTPPGLDYYLHSSGGIYGLDFLENILKDLDNVIKPEGYAQIVTFAPGDSNKPFMLENVLKKYLKEGEIKLRVNPIRISYDYFVDRFKDLEINEKKVSTEVIESMKNQARNDGITDLYLVMIHYDKSKPNSLIYEITDKNMLIGTFHLIQMFQWDIKMNKVNVLEQVLKLKKFAPPERELFEISQDNYGNRLALVFGNELGRCPFYEKECSFCEIGNGEGKKFTSEENLKRYKFFKEYYSNFKDINHLIIYNSGSTLNTREFSYKTLEGILKDLKDKDIKAISFDTRPRFIDDDKIQLIKSYLDDKDIYFTIGLETYDDSKRRNILNKNITKEEVENAFKIVSKYENIGIEINILAGHPGLKAEEVFDEALNTIKYGLSLGKKYGVKVNFNFHPFYHNNKTKLKFPNFKELENKTIEDYYGRLSDFCKRYESNLYFGGNKEGLNIE